MYSLKTTTLSILLALCSSSCFAAETSLVPDLAKTSQNEEWAIYHRTATFVKEDNSVSFDAQPMAGVAWLKNSSISNGVIEVDLKGSDVKDKSYIGIAFRGQDEKNYEAVYFRPFNFNAPDELHKSHSVQYVAEPEYPWEKLRKEQPGKYENTLSPSVNPNEFFHVKIVLEKPQVRVYVNNATEPTLVVEDLATQKSGWVGFWMGKNAGGAFKNLKITTTDKE